MRVVVTGGRDYTDAQAVRDALLWLKPEDEIIEGGARGADTLARNAAMGLGLNVITVWANWQRHGKKAGPIRNARMLDMPGVELVLAFPGGRGTADCIRQAERRDIHVKRVR